VDLILAKSGGVIRRRNIRSGAKDVGDGSDIRTDWRDEELSALLYGG